MTTIDVEGEEIPASSVASLVPAVITHGALVTPAAATEAIVDAFRAYQELRGRLLVPADFQNISGKQYPKKSAWRKLGVAFGVDLDIKERVYERNDAGRIVRAEIVATATAPNGRHADGLGACDVFEKCCQPGCRKGGNHRHCATDCPGTIHFSNPQHDIPATAETRAKNRAASDLFGMGEVSAEEIVGDTGWWGGWGSEEELHATLDPIIAKARALSPAAHQRLKEWREARGMKMPMPKADAGEWIAFVHELAVSAGAEASGYLPGEEPFESAGEAQQRAIDEADEHMAQVGP